MFYHLNVVLSPLSWEHINMRCVIFLFCRHLSVIIGCRLNVVPITVFFLRICFIIKNRCVKYVFQGSILLICQKKCRKIFFVKNIIWLFVKKSFRKWTPFWLITGELQSLENRVLHGECENNTYFFCQIPKNKFCLWSPKNLDGNAKTAFKSRVL